MIDIKLKEFLDNLDKGAYITDRKRRIIYWNKQAERLTGYKAQEVIGKSCQDNILRHVDRSGVLICRSSLCPLYRTMKTGESARVPFAVRALTKDGKRIPVSISTYPIFVDGEVVGGLEIFDEGKREEMDLKISIGVQMALVPKNLPENIDMLFRPSDFIGGDLPYYKDPWIGIADVSGHGVSAALVASSLKIIMDGVFSEDPNPQDLPLILEEKFQELGDIDLYFTAIFARLEGRRVTLVSMGHVEPLAVRSGVPEVLNPPKNFPVGFGMKEKGKTLSLEFSPGDMLLLISDGIKEIRTGEGMLGLEGVVEILKREKELVRIYEKALEKSNEVVQEDDITMFLVRF